VTGSRPVIFESTRDNLLQAHLVGRSHDNPILTPFRRSSIENGTFAVPISTVNGADGEGDAVHGGQESDGWQGGGTDLDDDAWHVRQHGMRDVADESDRGRPDQEAPEEPDSTVGFLWVISMWVVIVFPCWR
jgi:hypothetical protein